MIGEQHLPCYVIICKFSPNKIVRIWKLKKVMVGGLECLSLTMHNLTRSRGCNLWTNMVCHGLNLVDIL